ncbi:MAG: FMN-binding negative transcriptional regulator [Lysobacterales bacterium]
MYLPKHFEQSDESAQVELIRCFPLATVIYGGPQGPVANHIPMRVRRVAGAIHLVGHVARANTLWREADGQPVLAVFHGSQAYVSPQWYPSKAVDGRAVPTWNYCVVHAHGRLQAIDDPIWLRQLLDELSAEHEAFQPRPWRLDEAPPDYVERQLRAIVGIELRVERLIGKDKLHQNHPEANRRGVIEGLSARDQASAQDVAAQMAARLED